MMLSLSAAPTENKAVVSRSACPAQPKKFKGRGIPMLWTIVVILVVLWLLGFLGGVGGSVVHILLVLALIIIVVNLLSGRRGNAL
jgi:hypothetical protein